MLQEARQKAEGRRQKMFEILFVIEIMTSWYE
jgi:hypothetical protein